MAFEISVKLSLGKLFRVQPLERPPRNAAVLASKKKKMVSKISSMEKWNQVRRSSRKVGPK